MSSIYDRFGVTAEKLLTKFGSTRTLTRTTNGAYDPATGGSTGTVSNVTGVGVTVPIRAREANGTTIQVGDQRLIFRGDTLEIGDMLDGYRVSMLEGIDPAGTGNVIQKAIMRR